MIYKFGTDPYQHQLDCFNLSVDSESFAYFLEQGLGKTKVAIDVACYLYTQGKIDCVVILAPNIVHNQWVNNEAPIHIPDYIDWHGYAWTNKNTIKENKKRSEFFNAPGLPFFSINYEAIITVKGREFLKHIFTRFNNVYLVADESQFIRTPSAKRTRAAIALSKRAKFKRILTGTPIPNGPLGFYSQGKFLDSFVWGGMTFAAFKSRYALWEQRKTSNNRRGHYLHLVGYQNLDELIGKISPISVRYRKKDCLDLPDKIYQEIPFELPSAHASLYKEVEKNAIVELEPLFDDMPPFKDPSEKLVWMVENLEKVEANTIKIDNALTKMIRLKQITSGYYVPEDGEARPINGKFPKIEVLIKTISNIEGKVIIWANFTNLEHGQIAKALDDEYGFNKDVYRFYNGWVKDKEAAKNDFINDPEVRFLIANQAAGGRGLNLQCAGYHIYYSQDMDAEKRSQSEDRSHRIGQTKNVVYIDLIAEGTVDRKIKERLIEKIRHSSELLEKL